MAKPKPKLDIVSGNDESPKTSKSHKENITFSLHTLTSFKPITPPQEQFVKSYNSQVPIIFQVGSAGTGKSMMALYSALTDVLDKSTVYDKVVIIRSAVAAREIGFLPGDLESKNEILELPYKSLCDELMTFKSNNYRNLKAKNLLEFHNTSYLRGMTFDDTVVIVDEFQSMTYHELSTIMTRVGINSRIVFSGDFFQNDLHKKGDVSGFHKFMKIISNMPEDMVNVITYTPNDIVRSGIVKEFLLAEERIESKE